MCKYSTKKRKHYPMRKQLYKHPDCKKDLNIYMKCTMHSPVRLPRHNWRYHVNIKMREHTEWHVSVTSESNTATHRLSLLFGAIWRWWCDLGQIWFQSGVSVMSAEMKSAHCAPTGRGSFQVSGKCAVLWPDGSVCGERPRLVELNRLHVIGRVQTQLAVI